MRCLNWGPTCLNELDIIQLVLVSKQFLWAAHLIVSVPLFAPLVIFQLQVRDGGLEVVHQLVLALLLG